MEAKKFLTDLGLSPAAADVYLALLKSGNSSIRQVAEWSGINRGTTYDALKQLHDIGLVGSHVKGERRKYFAESPQKINNLANDQLKRARRLKDEALQVIPNLMPHDTTVRGAPLVRFYEDDEGIALILKDVLETVAQLPQKEYCVYSSRALRQYIYRRFPSFTKQRIKSGLFVRVIAIGTGGDPVEVAERKFLEESKTELSSSYNIIFGNKVALIAVSMDLTPYGVVIEEPGMAAMQRHLFEILWDRL